MQHVRIKTYILLGYGTVIRLVGTKVSVSTYCVRLPTASEDTPRILLKNIDNHVAYYTVS